jgi:hypothetical protein
VFESSGQEFCKVSELFRVMLLQLANNRTVSEDLRNELRAHSNTIIDLCKRIGAPATVDSLKRCIQNLDKIKSISGLGLVYQTATVCFYDEMARFHALILNPEDAKRYNNQRFSAETTARFPEAVYDMEEAGKSLGVRRSTATVFHLMRVLEVAIRDWSTKLGVPLARLAPSGRLREEMWGDLESTIQAKVSELPESTYSEKEGKNAQRAAIASFQNVRYAWRNPTMHPAAKYTPEEADDVFDSVVRFTDRLAKLI